MYDAFAGHFFQFGGFEQLHRRQHLVSAQKRLESDSSARGVTFIAPCFKISAHFGPIVVDRARDRFADRPAESLTYKCLDISLQKTIDDNIATDRFERDVPIKRGVDVLVTKHGGAKKNAAAGA